MKPEQDNDLDKLLSDLKSEYKTSNAVKKTQSPDNRLNSLLEEFKSEIKSSQTSNQAKSDINNYSAINQDIDSIRAAQKKQKSDDRVNNLLEEFKSEIKSSQTSNQANNDINNYSAINQDIDSIRAKYQNNKDDQKRRAELTYNQNKQEIINQEQQKQLKRKQLIRQAEKWLENLDPTSDEGMWFNQLAESYPSKLDAAINYLGTLNQSDS
ncbi:MAG: hypothetical protein QNJ60_07855 [Xenococcaceae cyanobacterium MO_188.B19]|nr:hypothetical protein [Xenococcaceae cyanobacterium MO_188.B19]